MTTGLVLGKFAPLHTGHQSLIDAACTENDQVIVMVYDASDVTHVPLPVRAGWIKALYPNVTVIEAWDGPIEVGDTPEIKRMHEDYILSMLAGQSITHFYSSEFYGEHVSQALGARDRRIDPARQQIPVSATLIRQDSYKYRQYLNPLVYRDLVTRVVFVGAPSSGKTTLARELAAHYQTVWMPEYGREYWEQHQADRRLTPEQLVEIAEGHIEREETLLQEARDILFVDTDATTTCQFSQYYHGKALPQLVQLADQARSRYDIVFLCDIDIPYDDTWDRSGESNRVQMQKMIRADLLQRRIAYITLTGCLDARIQTVRTVLDQYDRYRSLADHLRNPAKQ